MRKLLIAAILLEILLARGAPATVPVWSVDLSGNIPYIITSYDFPLKGGGWFLKKEAMITGISTDEILQRIVPSWDGIVKTFANIMITMFKEAMLDWVRNGFDAGGPMFVQNPSRYFGEAVDEATGGFIAELGNTVAGDPEFFCRNFGPEVIVNFGLSYRGRPFRERARCTLSDVAENIEDVSSRFENYGWKGFFQLQQDNNNPLGMQLLLFEEQMARAEARLDNVRSESAWGQGYKTARECVSYEDVPAGDGVGPPQRVCKSWKTKTLGTQIGDRVTKTLGLDFEGLQAADEISEFVGALLDLALREALEAGLSD